MKNIRDHPKAGFTLVEIMIVVAIIGLLAAMAIPNLVRARQTSQTKVCINNLRIIDTAKQQWALETGQGSIAVPANSDIVPYLGKAGTAIPLEPLGGTYILHSVDTAPTCSRTDTNTHAAALPN